MNKSPRLCQRTLLLFNRAQLAALVLPKFFIRQRIWLCLGNAASFTRRERVFLSRSACPLRWFGTGRPCFEQDARIADPISDRSDLQLLFEQLPQILKCVVFFVRLRAIGEKELLAQVQCLSLHCSGIKPVLYRSQELISVPLTFARVPCVTNRSRIELIERYFRVPIELRDPRHNRPAREDARTAQRRERSARAPSATREARMLLGARTHYPELPPCYT